MNPRLEDGWLTLDYAGSLHSQLHIAVGSIDNQYPAFRDSVDGRIMLKVRPPAGATGRVPVWLVVDGAPSSMEPVKL